jgi:hypothetical protein
MAMANGLDVFDIGGGAPERYPAFPMTADDAAGRAEGRPFRAGCPGWWEGDSEVSLLDSLTLVDARSPDGFATTGVYGLWSSPDNRSSALAHDRVLDVHTAA